MKEKEEAPYCPWMPIPKDLSNFPVYVFGPMKEPRCFFFLSYFSSFSETFNLFLQLLLSITFYNSLELRTRNIAGDPSNDKMQKVKWGIPEKHKCHLKSSLEKETVPFSKVTSVKKY